MRFLIQKSAVDYWLLAIGSPIEYLTDSNVALLARHQRGSAAVAILGGAEIHDRANRPLSSNSANSLKTEDKPRGLVIFLF